MYNFLPKNRLNWLEPQHPGLVLVERSEDLLCAHTFIHCLLFAVNGGWTAERVPEDAELVAAGSSYRESLKCQLLWWRGNRRWRTALACDGRVISEQRCCHDFKQLSLLFSLGIPLCFKRVVRTSRHTHTHIIPCEEVCCSCCVPPQTSLLKDFLYESFVQSEEQQLNKAISSFPPPPQNTPCAEHEAQSQKPFNTLSLCFFICHHHALLHTMLYTWLLKPKLNMLQC